MIEQHIIDAVIDQIKFDIDSGDLTAIEELLKVVPEENLIGFLVEEKCHYCGGNCSQDEEYACDGYLGDIDNLYAEENLKIDLDGGLSAINE